jgi:hypothetical protein
MEYIYIPLGSLLCCFLAITFWRGYKYGQWESWDKVIKIFSLLNPFK